jgi:RNA polymerase sigma-70 factor (ECF subfamily)
VLPSISKTNPAQIRFSRVYCERGLRRICQDEAALKTSESEDALTQRASNGDAAAMAELFDLFRPRLWRLVNFRMDGRLQGRVDPDDVLQEAWLSAAARAEHLQRESDGSRFIWFRMIVSQTLIDVHRRHLQSERRDATRETRALSGWDPGSTSFSLAEHLLGGLTSPSQALLRAEVSAQLDVALKTLSELDQEVLALRHFEELSNTETAEVLQLTEQAASIRYVRALARLKDILQRLPGFEELRRAGQKP